MRAVRKHTRSRGAYSERQAAATIASGVRAEGGHLKAGASACKPSVGLPGEMTKSTDREDQAVLQHGSTVTDWFFCRNRQEP